MFVHVQKWFYITCEFYRFLVTKDEPNFPQQNNLILQKKVSGVDKVVNFKDFSRPNKVLNQVLFKDVSRQLVKFKTFSRL